MKADRFTEEARRLLSCMEQAQRLVRAVEHELRAGRLDRGQHEALVRDYQGYAARAAARLAKVRAAAASEAARAGKKLQRALAAQQSAAGQVGRPEKYRERIVRLRQIIEKCNRVIGARNAAAVGGFLDWDLKRYQAFADAGPGEFAPTRANFILAGITAALLLIAVGATYFFTYSGGEVQIKAHLEEQPQPRIRVFFKNTQAAPVALYVGGDEETPPSVNSQRAYRVAVYIDDGATEDSENFRLVADVARAWFNEGVDFSRRDHLIVDPYEQVHLGLLISGLRSAGLEVERVRLLFTGPGGKVIATHDFSL